MAKLLPKKSYINHNWLLEMKTEEEFINQIGSCLRYSTSVFNCSACNSAANIEWLKSRISDPLPPKTVVYAIRYALINENIKAPYLNNLTAYNFEVRAEYDSFSVGKLFSAVDPIPTSSFQNITLHLSLKDRDGTSFHIGQLKLIALNIPAQFIREEELMGLSEKKKLEALASMAVEYDEAGLANSVDCLCYILCKNKRNRDVNAQSCAEEPRICYISQFYLKPRYRGHKIGSYIFKNIHEIVTGATRFNYDPNFYIAVIDPFHDTPEAQIASEYSKAAMRSIIAKTAKSQGFTAIRYEDTDFIYKFTQN